jgi:hypothetical protein
MEWVEAIAREPHPCGSEANARVRELLETRLTQLGLPWERRPWSWAPPDGEGPRGVNLLARLPAGRGDGEGPVALFVAHYDARPGPGGGPEGGTPGAGDNGAAVAAFLEALRALHQGPAPANELWFLFTDGEELGLLGAEVFAATPDALERVAVVLNFEGRGNGGPVVLFETGRDDAAWVGVYAEAVPWPQASSLGPTLYERLPNDTDFSVFKRRGLPGLNFAFIGGGSAYHRPWDRPRNLDARTLQHHGEIVLGMARALGGADLEGLAARRGQASFFTLPGNVLLHYPQAADGALLALAALVLAATIAQGLRARTLRAPGLVLATLSFPAFAALLGGSVVAIAWLLDAGVRGVAATGEAFVQVEPRGNLQSSTWATSGVLVLATFLSALLAARMRAAWLETLTAGACLAWLALGTLAVATARGASHVLTVPALFASLSLYASLRARSLGSGPLSWCLIWGTAAAALLVLLPVAKLLGQVGSITHQGTVHYSAPVAALAGALFLPALRLLVIPSPRWSVVLTGLGAVGLLVAASWVALSGR